MDDGRRFIGKIVLVTGGTSGIGKATAFAFLREGAMVVAIGKSAEEGESMLREAQGLGETIEFLHADISREEDVHDTIIEIRRRHGRLDCAFNNAGGESVIAPLHTLEQNDAMRLIDVDLKGTWLCMKHEIPLMLEGKGGSIVNAGAVAGLGGVGGSAMYSAVKHAVIGLTKSAALEVAQHGIRVNATCPGIIQTPTLKRIQDRGGFTDEQMEQWWKHEVPAQRLGAPEDVAQVVLWLCSDDARYVTGQAIPIDGGITAR